MRLGRMKGKKAVTAALVALVMAALAAWRGEDPSLPSTGMVERVYDGDTLLVNAGVKLKVRVLGIDTPEKDGPYTKAEPFGAEATARMKSLAEGRVVTLDYAGEETHDKYGRSLAYVILPGGESAGELLLAEGLAEVFRMARHPLKARYGELQARARAACLGMWRARCARKAH